MSLSRKDHIREARAYQAFKATKRTDATPSRTFVNSAMKVPYKGLAMASPRADADAHLQHASRDSGAQIVRVAA